jgi:hypothetical protein
MYVPNFYKKYSNVLFNHENDNVFTYIKEIVEYEKEYEETGEINDF